MSAILFAIQHAPEILAALKALFAFFKEHRKNPQMSSWMKEMGPAMEAATASKDPRPLLALIERMKKDLQA